MKRAIVAVILAVFCLVPSALDAQSKKRPPRPPRPPKTPIVRAAEPALLTLLALGGIGGGAVIYFRKRNEKKTK